VSWPRRCWRSRATACLRSSSQGEDDQASQAGSELPDKIDADNAQHAALLSKHEIVSGSLSGHLGGLGKSSDPSLAGTTSDRPAEAHRSLPDLGAAWFGGSLMAPLP
jgi:hypothetical protein